MCGSSPIGTAWTTGNGEVSEMAVYRIIRKAPGIPDDFFDLEAPNWAVATVLIAKALSGATTKNPARIDAITEIIIVRKP